MLGAELQWSISSSLHFEYFILLGTILLYSSTYPTRATFTLDEQCVLETGNGSIYCGVSSIYTFQYILYMYFYTPHLLRFGCNSFHTVCVSVCLSVCQKDITCIVVKFVDQGHRSKVKVKGQVHHAHEGNWHFY